MPLTVGGQLSIVASHDLGALGAKDGMPVIYNWVAGHCADDAAVAGDSGIAGLETESSRGCLADLAADRMPDRDSIRRSRRASRTERNLSAMPLPTWRLVWRVVWLLSDYLRRGHRILTFLCVLLAMAGFSALAFVSQQSLNMTSETISVAIALAVGVATTTAALSLCGLICRGRYRPIGLYVWLLLVLAVTWLVIFGTFYLLITLAQRGAVEAGEVFLPILALAAGNFAVLLPFLILLSASPLYRERLKALLHVKPEPPPMPAPLPEATLKA